MKKYKRLLFIESRTQTTQWDLVANKLAQEGYEIYWIVCSKVVMPETGDVRVISFPLKKDLRKIDSDLAAEVSLSDRIVKYYGGDTTHYEYYAETLSNEIQCVQPDIVFGELANFHTHIVAKLCAKKGIPFFQPSTSRYPNSRFRFFMDDDLIGYERHVERIPSSIVTETENNIFSYSKQPDYMLRPSKLKLYNRKFFALIFKLKLLYQRFQGDIYNIPSLSKVLALHKQAKINLKKWESESKTLSEKFVDKEKKYLLLPLQMQPEFNLDVWGRRYNNQVDIIKGVLQYLPAGWDLIVKLNPKSFLELSDELLDACQHPRVHKLALSVSMPEVLNVTNAVLTVTGTIAIECSVKNINVFCLAKSDFSNYPFVHYLENIEEIKSIDERLQIDSEKSNIIQYLYEHSFEGVIGEEITNPACNSPDNIEMLAKAFRELLTHHRTEG